jgi:hypothetical protein
MQTSNWIETNNLMIYLLKRYFNHRALVSCVLTVLVLSIISIGPRTTYATDNLTTPVRWVNISNLEGVPFTPAVFWFGQVTPTSNHANVRVWYYNSQIKVVVHIIDRRLWYDPAQSLAEMTKWDAVSLYLDLDGIVGGVPDKNAYLFQSQLDFQAGYRGNGTGWQVTSIPFSTDTGWRGNYPNDNIDDKGWQVEFTIPFTSLGLSKAPSKGSIWGLAVVVHDRDDAGGTQIPDQFWPETMQTSAPSTWGQMHFGMPSYSPPLSLPMGVTTIRQGLNGMTVEDAHVGGHTTCGDGLDHWTEWGIANYAGYEQINIQNQWDVADYPCFSKYYVTFPLDALPLGKTIISATLRMVLFGNAGGGNWGEPPDSYIQALTVNEDWVENSITWNNAPLALENISGTWVKPRDYDLPDTPYQWDVSRAVADAYMNGQPLRLALYSADGEMHSGKYFWSSDSGDWNASARPTLKVVWGVPCDKPGIECNFVYIPMSEK